VPVDSFPADALVDQLLTAGDECQRTEVGDHHCSLSSLPLKKLETEAAIETKFRQSPHWDFGDVTCRFFEGMLTLRGQVRSYYVRQMAQELIRPISAVKQIDNRLQVVPSQTSS
jgi:hypothetical protein